MESCNIDVIVFGEGEVTLPKIIECMESKSDLFTVPGIAYKKESEIIRTKPETKKANLDDLPLINPDYLKLENYKHSVPYRCLVDEKALQYKKGWS